MAIPVACACGATLRAPDGAVGRKVRCPKCGAAVPVPAPADPPAADAPPPPIPKVGSGATKRCAYCGAKVPVEAPECAGCGRPFGSRAAPAETAEENEPEAPAPEGFPWELIFVLGVVFVDGLVGLVLHGGVISNQLLGALVADLLIMLGVALRREWGFWISTVILSLRTVVNLYLLPQFAAVATQSMVIGFVALGVLANALAAGLLIWCRVRGAFAKPELRASSAPGGGRRAGLPSASRTRR